MKQGILPFQYEQEKISTGMTALAGLPPYLDLAQVAGLSGSIERHVRLREEGQGWTDSQMVMSLLLLNLAGGESVDDLRVLEKDEGLCRVLRRVETHGMRRRERRATEKRWRKERRRSVPSPSAVFRYLCGFHDDEEEANRQAHTAFIPAANEALAGLGRVNGDLVAFMQSHLSHKQATLDMDATLVETEKTEALYSYKKYKAYQPLTTYWAEADLIVHSEFRDGNVPAGYQQLRLLKEALAHVPDSIGKVLMRSDTAGYQQDLLKYCAEDDEDKPFGVIEFAVGVDVTSEFKQAVAEVAEEDWQTLKREVNGRKVPTDQQWAEVCFVPNWIGHSKNSPDYRFIAIREPLRRVPLPGMESQLNLPIPTMELVDKRWYKVSGVVTNRELEGDQLIWWYRQRCGKSEEAHGVLKEDLAAGRLPSGRFGANAAWWGIAVLAFNLNCAMKRFALGTEWVSKRLKAVRFAFICLPGRVVRRARMLIIRLTRDHPSYGLLLKARHRILALAHGPP
jgi:hypothetical protein|tara:strand:- start:237 stop:1763 length:1527 start_codon:yes stop_codon:yes gene_type:complete